MTSQSNASDLVERLRGLAELLHPDNTESEAGLHLVANESADEIERLCAQLATARKALEEIAQLANVGRGDILSLQDAIHDMHAIALRTLTPGADK